MVRDHEFLCNFPFPKNHISRLPFWCASICSLPFGWLGFSFPGPKWLRACCGWGDAWVAWSRVGLNFPLLTKFFCSLHISLSLSTHHLAASSSLLPDHGMPPLDLLPPAAAHLLMRPLGIRVFLPLPPKYAPSLEQIEAHSKG